MASNEPQEPQPSSEHPPGGDQPTNPNPSETPSQAAPRGLKGAGLRYAEDDDTYDWARGKTADEIVEITEQLRRQLVTQQPPPQTPQQPQNTVTPPSNGIDPDLIYSNAAEYTQRMQGYVDTSINQQLQQASAPILAPLATMARDAASRDPSTAEVWKRYGPEIDATMAAVPLQNRADVNMWRQAAELVAGKHYRELARLEAERLASTSDGGILPTGGIGGGGTAGGGSLDPIDKLFAEDHPSIQAFKAIHKSASDVRAHAAAMGHTPEAYAEMLKSKRTLRYVEAGTPREVVA